MTHHNTLAEHQALVSDIAARFIELCRSVDRERAFRVERPDTPLPPMAPATIPAHSLLDSNSAVRSYLARVREYGAAIPALPEVETAERRRKAEQARIAEMEAETQRQRERNLAAAAEQERKRLAVIYQ